MKGILNNQSAFDTLQNAKKSLEHRIAEIYNLGYKQGYKDGSIDTVQKIAKEVTIYNEK